MKELRKIIAIALFCAQLFTALPRAEHAGRAYAAEVSETLGTTEETSVGTGEVLTLSEYDSQLSAMESGAEAEALAVDADYTKLLLQRRLVEKAGYDKLTAKMNADADFAACINWLFGDYEMLCDYVYGGEPEANDFRQTTNRPNSDTYIKSFSVLSELYKAHGDDVTAGDNTALFKRLMAAVALTYSVSNRYFIDRGYSSSIGYKWALESFALPRYELYRKFYLNNLLVADFAGYNVEELRLVVGAQVDDAQLEWLNYYYRYRFLGDTDCATDPYPVTYSNFRNATLIMGYSTHNTAPGHVSGDKYYDSANEEMWRTKYHLTVHDGPYDFEVPYGLNDQGHGFEPIWVMFECGTVCMGISFTGVLIENAFGIPSIGYSQNDHASYTAYRGTTTEGVPMWVQYYNIYGLQDCTTKDYGNTHLPAGWGDLPYSSFSNAAYIIIGHDAVLNAFGTDFKKAENLVFMGNNRLSAGDAEGAAQLYEKALAAQYYNLDAWDGLVKAYRALGKTNADYYALACRAAENLKWYPLSMYDFINGCVLPNITGTTLRAETLALLADTLTVSAAANESSGLSQPSYCRTLASSCAKRLYKPVTFSYESGGLTLSSDYSDGTALLYSLDNGAAWTTKSLTAGEMHLPFTGEELAAITAENDILYKFDGQERYRRIDITKASKPASNLSKNTPNDNEDKFINIQSGLEWSINEGESWHNLDYSSTFLGDVTVRLRVKETGTVMASDYIEVTFTQGEGTPERSYIKRTDGAVALASTPDGMKANPASYAFDGNTATYWLNLWSNLGKSLKKDDSGAWVTNHNYEFVFKFNVPRFISGVSYLPADAESAIRGLEAYISSDGVNWMLAGSVINWAASADEKSLDFSRPGLASYIKLRTTAVGTKAFNGYDAGYAGAREFKFYENYAVDSKTPASLSLDVSKTDYKVGDAIDKAGIKAVISYTDGASAVITGGMLDYSEEILKEAGTKTITASYAGVSSDFSVNVAANDRTASAIVSATAAERKYYAGDAVDKSDVLVLVKDASESWYLMPEEYEISGTLAEGANTLTVTHNALTAGLSVTALKAPSSLELNTEAFKAQYMIGETLDLSGLKVTKTNTDGSTEELSEADYTAELYSGGAAVDTEGFSRLSGAQTLRISLGNKAEIYAETAITVFPYITNGNLSFEAVEGTNTCVLTRYTPENTSADAAVTIPETVTQNGIVFTVVGISGGAFSDMTGLESVTIPGTVTRIESDAFSGCVNLTRVYMTYHETFDGFSCAEGAFEAVTDGYVYLHGSLAGSVSPIPGYSVADFEQLAREITLTPPSRTDYVLNEPLDTEGMTLTAILSDGSSMETKAYTLSGAELNTVGERTVTVSLNGTGLKASFTVNVSFPEVTVAVSPLPAAYANGMTVHPLLAAAEAEHNEVKYKWYKDGTAIDGANSAEYTPTADGTYYAAAYVEDAAGNKSGEVNSDSARIMMGDFEAICGTVGFEKLADALNAAETGAEVIVCKDCTLASTVTISGRTITLDGEDHMVSRAAGFAAQFIILDGGAALTLENITLDGGAVWTGDNDATLGRGTVNSGITAAAPLVLARSGTTLNILSGTVLQNNDNIRATSGDEYFGGAVSANTAAVLLDGGTICDNSSGTFGSAIYVRGTGALTVQSGIIERNSDPAPSSGYNASAICMDNSSNANINGGVYRDNRGGKEGGVFRLGYGSITISGGLFENNSTSGSGGVLYVYNENKGSAKITGGTFRNNTAAVSGGVVYTPKAISLSGCELTGNKALSGSGGAVWVGGAVSLGNAGFSENTAAQYGSGMYISGGSQLTVTNLGEKAQEIYMETFKSVIINGTAVAGKTLILGAPEGSFTDTTDIATLQGNIALDASINGKKLYTTLTGDAAYRLRANGEKAMARTADVNDGRVGFIIADVPLADYNSIIVTDGTNKIGGYPLWNSIDTNVVSGNVNLGIQINGVPEEYRDNITMSLSKDEVTETTETTETTGEGEEQQ